MVDGPFPARREARSASSAARPAARLPAPAVWARSSSAIVAGALDALAQTFRGSIRTDDPTRDRFGADASHVRGRPMAVVAPRDRDDVVTLVRWARSARIGLVARGAGTSLDGESVPTAGGVVVDLSGWNRVVEVKAEERWARVGPGTINEELQRALLPLGLFYPPNPGSWTVSTIGGQVGTNASGPRSFRYGPTRGWVRAVDVVLGTGEIVRWGSLAAKRSVGPDLLGLFVGSEGTLGIATEVTVRLAPRPPVRRGVVVPLSSGGRLAPVAIALDRAPGTGLSAVEYLDPSSAAELSEDGLVARAGTTPLLLLELEAEDAADGERRLDRVRAALRGANVPAEPTVWEDADALWAVRGRAGVALDARIGLRVREDVAVPIGSIDLLARELERIAEREGVRLYLFGHLGEGSLHPNYAVDPASERADRIRAATLAAALSLRGTISGEHGIGAVKPPFLEREIGAEGVRLLRAIKAECDPDGILNPGKLYPRGGDRPVERSSPSPSGSAAGRVRPE